MKQTTVAITLLILFIFTTHQSIAQQPPYTPKLFRTAWAPGIVKIDTPENGIGRTYAITDATLWDVDNNNSTHVKWNYKVLIIMEGPYKNGKREGIFVYRVVDSLNPAKTYPIYEQTFKNDQLNGVWKTYNLQGTLVGAQTFENNIQRGLSTTYWIDGKRIMDEKEILDGERKYIQRNYNQQGILAETISIENKKRNGLRTIYFPNGNPQRQVMLVDGVPNGPAKTFYENGIVAEEVNFENGEFNGTRRYFYPDGKVWIEEIYKEGKHWTVIANYDASGKKRNPGTLKNGNGTLILYNEDGTVRETATYINGVEQ
ncbi:toxin-antitoxin system YwqK family antitoxin [Lacibacter sp.]|uniref:toxin-antitoxin system YwqK family antitoxin n=1 Tax=Lacibacter sp. TaxID=1915409 RepID=UPI002B4B65D5|nr:toxin-antitoxin system YwqK family antitoxin [Lacibacter sp.]HLP37064.1 toxin-antitoxin system YwqK family antitoxin [Lacibacter sp.]